MDKHYKQELKFVRTHNELLSKHLNELMAEHVNDSICKALFKLRSELERCNHEIQTFMEIEKAEHKRKEVEFEKE